MLFLQWLVIFPIAFLLAWFSRIFCSWWVTMFIVRTQETDTVKRLGKITATLPRDNLIRLFKGFNTHDNNTDEWWYGVYNVLFPIKTVQKWTQADYDNSKLIRWFCRTMWLWRNSAYGFNYTWFSKPKSNLIKTKEYGNEQSGKFWYAYSIFEKSFQFEAHIPFGFGYFNSINIGWKEHTGKDRLLFAGRILGIRNNK